MHQLSFQIQQKQYLYVKRKIGETEVLNQNKEKIFEDFENVSPIETKGNTTNLPYEKSILKYQKDGKCGLIDFEGKAITKPIYEELSSVKYKEGEILAKKNGKYGVISAKGKKLIPFEYKEIEADKYYNNGYQKTGYIVKEEKENDYGYGYIDSNWKKLLDTDYSEIRRVIDIEGEDVYLIVAKKGQYGLIKNKKSEVDFSYNSISYNKDTNLLSVQKGDKYGVINLKRRNSSTYNI